MKDKKVTESYREAIVASKQPANMTEFEKTRKKAIKTMLSMEKKKINVHDRHDAIWLMWLEYNRRRCLNITEEDVLDAMQKV